MIHRILTFGLVFLTAGALLLVAAYTFNRGPIWIKKYEEHSAEGVWTATYYVDTEASDLAECAAWGGVISLTLATGFLAGSAISAKGRSSFSG